MKDTQGNEIPSMKIEHKDMDIETAIKSNPYEGWVRIINGMVAVEPIDFDHAKGEKKQLASRFVTTDRVANLIVESKAVFATQGTDTQPRVSPGDSVIFRADVVNIMSARQVLEYDGKQFVLIPIGAVVGVKYR